MPYTEGVVFAFAHPGETANPLIHTISMKLIAPAGQNFMGIRLMANVPDKFIERCFEHIVNGYGQFDRAKAGTQVTRISGNHLDDISAQFITQGLELLLAQPAKVSRRIDLLQQISRNYSHDFILKPVAKIEDSPKVMIPSCAPYSTQNNITHRISHKSDILPFSSAFWLLLRSNTSQMILLKTHDNREAFLRVLTPGDYPLLSHYLENLSEESKRRFGPHPFDLPAVEQFHLSHSDVTGYIATGAGGEIIAYALIKQGYADGDLPRLTGYGIEPQPATDCSFAPSVADAWQSCGLGTSIFGFIHNDCRHKGFKRMFLWGGVQSTNLKAVRYYGKLGFFTLGQFEHNGPNNDMLLSLA